MPEGDTIFRVARTLDRALTGRIVTRFDSVLPAVTRVDQDHPIAGRTIESIASRGKHLLIVFSGELTLHTHMRMNGAWHIYHPGERWRRPRREMRVMIETADAVAVAFNVPVAELLRPRDLQRHRALATLGPDLLADPFDRADAVRRVLVQANEPIGEVLLNQRVLAGIGNVFKSEILFVAGIDPMTPVRALDADAVGRIVDVARRLLVVNVPVAHDRRGAHGVFGRRTRDSLDPRQRLWVYGRGGLPCRRCGTQIRSSKTGPDARLTYWCPACQKQSEVGRV